MGALGLVAWIQRLAARIEQLERGVALGNGTVSNAKLASMAESRIKGRAAGAGTGAPTDLTGTQATAILDAVVGDSGSGGTKGLVPAPAAGDAAAGKFLKADGTYAIPAGTSGAPGGASGEVQYNNAGALGGITNGTTGQVLMADGSGAPSFQTLPVTAVNAIQPDAITDLEMWLDADAITGLVNNDPVATWADQSGNANDATQATAGARPVYKTNIVNGLPVVRFDATDDGMTTPLTVATPYTIIYVGNYNVANGQRRAIQGQVNNRLLGPYNGYWTAYNGTFFTLGAQLPRANFVIHGFAQEANTYGWFLYDSFGFPMGGLQYGTATGTPTVFGALALGASGVVAEPFGGDMAEVVVYSRLLSNDEARGLFQYFIDKYDL
jgi:hypothetical protein